MLSKRTFLKLSVVGAAAGAGLVPPARAQTVAWKGYTYLPSAAKHGAAGLQRMFDRIQKETGGRITVQLNVGGSLPIKGSNITQAVGEGIVQVAGDGFFHGAVPIAGILRLPGLIQSRSEFEAAYAAMRGELLADFKKQGCRILASYLYPEQVFFGRDVIRSLADLKGKKVRVTSVEQGEFVKRIGGAPLTIATPEVATALERGVVDAIVTASIGGGIFYKDLLKSNYRLGVNYFDSAIVVSEDAFAKLSAADQAIVEAAAVEAGQYVTDIQYQEEPKTTAALKAGGMVISEATAADVRAVTDLMKSYWGEWAAQKGGRAGEALLKVRTALGRVA